MYLARFFQSRSWQLRLWGVALLVSLVSCFAPSNLHRAHRVCSHLYKTSSDVESAADPADAFVNFVEFMKETQDSIIQQVEELDGSGTLFSNEKWGGAFEDNYNISMPGYMSGGRSRVIQGGDVVEKGACYLTLFKGAILSAERAAAIKKKSRQDLNIQPGDVRSGAALSIVLHPRSPMVPTFRSDVRVFSVESENATTAWFGGGADLTPYFLFDEDIVGFHNMYRDLCANNPEEFSFEKLKKHCDDYFYLTARSEHRGTGGIFFDDMQATPEALAFVKGMAESWMPSWRPIVAKRRKTEFTERQKQWQLLRRKRFLEFNLLYDRGAQFGQLTIAPPIAFEYNHNIEEGSEEARLVEILKKPKDWATAE